MKTLNNFLIKTLILLFWITTIFTFLLIPRFKKNIENNTINVLTWGDMISLDSVSKFEKETGIKVNINFYETNEELFAKLNVTKAAEYDLMTVADNGMEFLYKNDLIKKIDKSKLTFFNNIDPHLYNHYFDKESQYSVPYYWDIYGLGINKKLLNKAEFEKSWSLIFDKNNITKKISMTDLASDAILVAAQYLFGSVKNLDKEKLNQIEKLLLEQKKWVEIYTDLRNDYILKYVCPAVVTQSAYIYNVLKKDNNVDNNLEFIIPKEGGFLIIDLLVVPKLSKKDNIIYKFINFLYQEDQMRAHTLKLGYLPVLKPILNSIDLDYLGGINKIFSPEQFSKFEFLTSNVYIGDITRIWTNIKS